MNKERRQRIGQILANLSHMQAELECLESEEQGAFDNLPESLQSSDKGAAMEDAIFQLNEAASAAQALIEQLEPLIES